MPIIAVFTKYDQFPTKVEIELEDEGQDNLSRHDIGGMHKGGTDCHVLINATIEALNDDVIAMMLVAVQKKNLLAGISAAVRRWC